MPALGTVQVDTAEVRVTEWRLPAGSAIGHHRHEHDYVVVPITDGELTAVSAAGTVLIVLGIYMISALAGR